MSLSGVTLSHLVLLVMTATKTTTGAQSTPVFSSCSDDSQCPDHASCRACYPDGVLCICNEGYVASKSWTVCENVMTAIKTTTSAQSTPILAPCSVDAQCPDHASCRARYPDGLLCICNEGYVASSSLTVCENAAYINEVCITKCAGLFMVCNSISRRCACSLGYVAAGDNQNCVLPRRGLLEEPCVEGCVFDREQECLNGVCKCTSNLRRMTREEIQAFNNRQGQCILRTYTLDGPILPTTTTTMAPSPLTTAALTVSSPKPQPSTTTKAPFRRVLSTCSSNSQCPAQASCRVCYPDGLLCICNEGYMASTDFAGCERDGSTPPTTITRTREIPPPTRAERTSPVSTTPVPTTSSLGSYSSGMTIGLAVGIGLALFLTLIAVGVVVVVRKKKRQMDGNNSSENGLRSNSNKSQFRGKGFRNSCDITESITDRDGVTSLSSPAAGALPDVLVHGTETRSSTRRHGDGGHLTDRQHEHDSDDFSLSDGKFEGSKLPSRQDHSVVYSNFKIKENKAKQADRGKLHTEKEPPDDPTYNVLSVANVKSRDGESGHKEDYNTLYDMEVKPPPPPNPPPLE